MTPEYKIDWNFAPVGYPLNARTYFFGILKQCIQMSYHSIDRKYYLRLKRGRLLNIDIDTVEAFLNFAKYRNEEDEIFCESRYYTGFGRRSSDLHVVLPMNGVKNFFSENPYLSRYLVLSKRGSYTNIQDQYQFHQDTDIASSVFMSSKSFYFYEKRTNSNPHKPFIPGWNVLDHH